MRSKVKIMKGDSIELCLDISKEGRQIVRLELVDSDDDFSLSAGLLPRQLANLIDELKLYYRGLTDGE